MSKIILAEVEHLQLFSDHLNRVVNLSGTKGQPFFQPRPPGTFQFDRFKETEESWNRPFEKPSWSRCWIVLKDDQVKAHCNLTARRFTSNQHRADLGMAIEPELQNQGLGKKLLQYVHQQARKIVCLEYIDLQVFSGNERALALYEKNGYEKRGEYPDAFRIHDQSITDIHMVLKLR